MLDFFTIYLALCGFLQPFSEAAGTFLHSQEDTLEDTLEDTQEDTLEDTLEDTQEVSSAMKCTRAQPNSFQHPCKLVHSSVTGSQSAVIANDNFIDLLFSPISYLATP